MDLLRYLTGRKSARLANEQPRILLHAPGSERIDPEMSHQLRPFVPDGPDCEQINFGQGEGQIRIGEAIWGIYLWDGCDIYELVLEEGELGLEDFARDLKRIRDAVSRFFRITASITVKGRSLDDSAG